MKSANRVLTALIVCILIGILPMLAGAASVSDFTDFPTGTWSEEAMTAAVNNGLLQGKGDGRIAPKDYLTRAEAATIINRAFGATVKADITKYTDVNPQDWYYSEFQKAVNMRTIVGVSDTEINPTGYITREAVMTVIARALVLSSQDTSVLAKFGDGSSVSPWASSHVAAMVHNGYVNGDDKGNVNPQAYITREEFAQIMHNIVRTYISQAGEITGTYNNLLVRAPGATLKNLTVNGDLIIADGVGTYDVTFTNVHVTGRIVFRGAGNVTFDKISTVGKNIVVNDVNKTVHFKNFQNEPIFTGIVLNTNATFIQGGSIVNGGSSSGGSDGPSIPVVSNAKYKIIVRKQHETNDYDEDEKTYDDDEPVEKTATRGSVINYTYERTEEEKQTYREPIITYNNEDRVNNGSLVVTVTLNRIAREVEDSSGVLHQLLAGQNTVTNTDTDDIIEILNEYEGNLKNKGYKVEFKDLYTGEPLDITDSEVQQAIISGEIAVKIEKSEAIIYTITYIVKNHPVATENAEYFVRIDDDGNIIGEYKGEPGSIFNTATYTYTVEDAIDLPWLDDYTDDNGTEYFFDGWYDSDEVDGDHLIGNDIIEGNIIDSMVQGTVGNKIFYAQYLPAAEYTKYIIETKTQKITDDANSSSKTYDRTVKRQLAVKDEVVTYRAKAKQGFKAPVVTYEPASKINNGDLVVTVTYDRIMYSVTTHNGEQKFYYGQNPVTNSSKIELIDILNEYKYAPENNGYTVYFKNKATNGSLILTDNDVKAKLANGEIDVLVVRTPKNYSINYELLDGEGKATFEPTDSQKKYNVEQDVVLPVPTWDGYTFLGWYEEATFENAVSQIAKYTTYGVKTFYAKWIVTPPQPVTYEVTFGGKLYTAKQGAKLGTAVDDQGNTLSSAFEAAKADIPNGYDFEKFYIGDEVAVTIDTIVSSDMAVAIKKTVRNYTITFNTRGKGVVKSITYNVENYMNVVLPGAKYDGYEFITWSKENGEEVDHIAPGTFDNLTFYAEWEAIEYTLKFNFSTNVKAQLPDDYIYTIEYDDYVLPDSFEGYTFGGWYDADGRKYTKITTGMFGVVSLTAELKPIDYTVVFETDGKAIVGNITYNIEYDTIVLDKPEANGYTFGGWYVNADFSGEAVTVIPAGSMGDIKYYAKWQIIDYRVVFETGGKGTVADVIYNVEYDTFTLPVPTFNGYTFGGWYVNADFAGEAVTEIPAGSFGDLKYYASWTIINYTIVFETNGAGTIDNIVYNVENDTITLPTITKDNHIFLGWYVDANFTGTPVTVVSAGSFGDKTYYAKWEEIPEEPVIYTISFNGVSYTVERGTVIGLAKDASGNLLSVAMEAASAAGKDGYKFDGFRHYGDDVTVITENTIAVFDMALYTKWSVVTYKIAFEANGKGVVADVYYDIESDEYVLPALTANGYTFGGWYDNNSFSGVAITKVPAGSFGDKTFYAKWTVIKYLIDFDTLGKVSISNRIYDIENPTFPLPEITCDGYTFGGWFDANGKQYTEIVIGTTGNLSLVAKWEIINYTIKFESNGGTAVADITYNVEDDTITLPTTSKEGYMFLGWYVDAEFTGTPVTVVDAGSFGDKTYYAMWEAIPPVPVMHTISFNGISYTVERGTAIGLAKDAQGNLLSDAMAQASTEERDGYTFAGFRSKNDDVTVTKDTIAVSDMVIGTKWSVITYKIAFEADGKGIVADVYYNIESATYVLPTLSYDGYVFGGWYLTKDFAGDAVTEVSVGSFGDKIFYAKWTAINYTVEFETNGKGIVADITYNIETDTVTLPAPLFNGYAFGGWYTNADFTGAVVTEIPAGSFGNLKYYASWKLIDYRVVFETNGKGIIANAYYNVESDTYVLPAPTFNGYAFGGWYINADLTGTVVTEIPAGSFGDLTYYAAWSLIDYTVVFDTNGKGFVGSVVYNVESDTVVLPAPVYNGYTFGGWYLTEDFAGNAVTEIPAGSFGDIKYYASWQIINYTIVFETNGAGTINNITYNVENDTITLPTISKDNYIFLGWYVDAGFTGTPVTVVPAGSFGDKKYYAKWEEIPAVPTMHTIIFNGVAYTVERGSAIGLAKDATGNLLSTAMDVAATEARNGYVFDGFRADGDDVTVVTKDTIAAGDMAIEAKWTAITYVITFDTKGVGVQDPITYTIESGDIRLPVLADTADYNFAGWYDNENLSGTPVTTVVAGSIGNKTFYAKWVSKDTPVNATLGFEHMIDGNTVEVYVTLDKIPYDIEDLASITLEYSQIPASKLKYISTKSEIGGNIQSTDGKIAWYADGAITEIPEDGRLFTIVYEKTAESYGDVEFSYTYAEITDSKNGFAKGYDKASKVIDLGGVVSTNSILGFDYTADDSMVEVYVTLDKLPYDINDLASITLEYAQDPKALKYVATGSEIGGNIQSTDGKIAWYADGAITEIPEDGRLFTIVYEKTAESYGDVEFSYTYAEITDSTDAVAKAYDKTSAVIKLGDVVPTNSILGFDYTADDSMVEVYVTLDKIPYDIKDLASITLEYAQAPEALKYVATGSEIGGNIQSTDGKIAWYADGAVTEIPEDGRLFTIVYEKTAESYGEVEFSYTYAEITDSTDAVAKAYDKTSAVIKLGDVVPTNSILGFDYTADDSMVEVYVTLDKLPYDINDLASITLEYSQIPASKLKYISTKNEIGGNIQAIDGKVAWYADGVVTEIPEDGRLFTIVYEKTAESYGEVEFSYTYAEITDSTDAVAKAYDKTSAVIKLGDVVPTNSILGFDYTADDSMVEVYVTLDKIPYDINDLASITLEYLQIPASKLKYISTKSEIGGNIQSTDGKIAWYADGAVTEIPEDGRLFTIVYEKTAESYGEVEFSYTYAEITDSTDAVAKAYDKTSAVIKLGDVVPTNSILGFDYAIEENTVEVYVTLDKIPYDIKDLASITLNYAQTPASGLKYIGTESAIGETTQAVDGVIAWYAQGDAIAEIPEDGILFTITYEKTADVHGTVEFAYTYAEITDSADVVTKAYDKNSVNVELGEIVTKPGELTFGYSIDADTVAVRVELYRLPSDLKYISSATIEYDELRNSGLKYIETKSNMGGHLVARDGKIAWYSDEPVQLDDYNVLFTMVYDRTAVTSYTSEFVYKSTELVNENNDVAKDYITIGTLVQHGFYTPDPVEYVVTFQGKEYVVYENEMLGDAIADDGVLLRNAMEEAKKKEGYTFDFFHVDGNDTIIIDIDTVVTSDVTVIAKYTIVNYNVVFNTEIDIDIENITYNIESDKIVFTEPTVNGYTFGGWYLNADFTGTPVTEIPAGSFGNVTVYANWTIINYDVVFNTRVDVDIENITYNIKSDKIVFVEPAANGYVFHGWYLNADFSGDPVTEIPAGSFGDVTVYANWTVVNYNVVYNSKVNIDIENITYNIESDTIVFVKPVVNGYTFVGWYLNADFTGNPVTEIPAGSFGDVDIYANWTVINYNIEFNTNIDIDIDNIVYNIESDTVVLPRPTYPGYIFLGWYIDEGLTIPVSEVPTGSFGHKTYYARWELVPPEPEIYTIVFAGVEYTVTQGDILGNAVDANGNTLSDAMAAAKAKDGYKLDGFYMDGNTDFVINTNIIATQSMTVVANFTVINYNVVFNTKVDIDIDNIVYNIESDTITFVTPVVDGYIFNGWYLSADFAGTPVTNIPAGSFGDVNVFASWTVIDYSIVFETYGKIDIDNIVYNIESDTITFVTPVVDGYAFGGWYLSADFTGTPVTNIPAGSFGDVKVFASWTLINYNATFNTNIGIEIEEIVFNIESDTIVLPTPSYEGYTFLGWYLEAEFITQVSEIVKGTFGNKIFYAMWKPVDPIPVIYTITFNGVKYTVEEGKTLAVAVDEYGNTLADAMAAVKDKDGYTLDGFHEEGNEEAVINLNIIAAKDMTVVVKFTVINYNIVFDTNGKITIDNWTYNIESDVVVLPTIRVEGFIFLGWYLEAECKTPVSEIAKGTFGDKTFYAKWEEIIVEPDTFTIVFENIEYTVNKDEIIGNAVDANGNTLADAMAAATADRDGYRFNAFIITDGEIEVTKDTIADKDMTITAKWELVTYTITFITNSEEVIEAITYTIETEVFGLPAPQDTESMIFIGWFDNKELSGDAVKEIATGTFGDKTFYAKWEEILPEYFTVKLYKGTNETPEGYYEVAENEYITQEMIDSVLGAPESYKATKGYTDSDGNVHNIYPELWYQVNGEWERFIPEDVAIVEDTDVYLLTKYISFGYSTDIKIKGVEIPDVVINVPYDSETDIGKTILDGLTEVRNTINKTLNGLEHKGVDPYQIIIDKLVDLKLVDEEGNILNLELDVPLHRFISEELITSTIDNYIDNNISNEEFIADILRNDTVVDMLIEDDSIKIKVMQDDGMRDKLLTDSVIREMISNEEVVSWIIEDETFKTEFINNDATFEYILEDLSELLANEEYHDMIIDACVEFVLDVYFEETKTSPELVNYIDSVLDSEEFIAEIEANPELRVLFKEEIKSRIRNLGDNPDIKAEIYDEIRTSDEFKQHIIDAVVHDESIMASLREDIREDLKKADSSYKNAVISAVRAEFNDTASTLRQSITDKIRAEMADEASELRASVIAAVKADLNDSSSTLKESVTEAIKNDFKDANSTLKASVIAEIKAEMADPASELRASVIDEVISDFANADSELRRAIIDEIKLEMADEASDLRASVIAEIKAQMADETSQLRASVIDEIISDFESDDSALKASVIEAVRNDFASPDSMLKASVTETIATELKTVGSSLRTTILDLAKSGSGDIADEVKAYARDNFKEDIKLNAKTAIKDSAKTWVIDNVDTVREEIKSGIKTDVDALTEAILSSGYDSVADEQDARQVAEEYMQGTNAELNDKLNNELDTYFADNANITSIVNKHFEDIYNSVYDDIFGKLYDDDGIFDEAYVSYVNDGSNLENAFDKYIADETNLSTAIDMFVEDDENLTDAITEYAKNRDNLEKAIDIYVSDDDNLEDAIDMYIEDAQNIEKAVDEYIKDAANISKAVDTFIKKDANIEKAIDTYVKDDANIEKAIDTYVKNEANVEKAIDMYIDDAANLGKAVDMYIDDDANLLSAINNYIADDDKLKEIFDVYAEDTENLIGVFNEYIKEDANLDRAFETFVADETRFDNFYEDYLGENASDPELFNDLFEKYYHAHVHDVAKEAYDNESLHDLVMDYVHDYTEELVIEYAEGTLSTEHPELVDTIDNLMENEFPSAMREQYFASGSTIKATVDELIETEGRKLITKYVEGTLDAETEEFISDTIHDNIGIIVDDYVAGILDEDIKTLIDDEINEYMKKLIDDYISGTDRETLSELIPTYAKDAVDALKSTDAFKNTISDFVSGNGVRVNSGNVMFVSILAELLGGYDYAKIKAEFLPANIAKYADIVGDDLIAKYVNSLFDDFVSGMNAAVDAVNADTDNGIEDAEYTFSTRPTVVVEYMNDFVVNYYNKLMNKAKAKLYEKAGTKIDNNPYAKQLVETNWIELYLDKGEADALKSGYKLKAELVDYYDVTLKQTVLLHDAITWYGNDTEMSIEQKLDAASALINTYANKANDVIMNYIENGELPKGYTKDMIISKVESIFEKLSGKISALDKVESLYDRFEDKINKAVDKAVEIYDEYANRNYDGFVDLVNVSVYADGKAYPVYQIVLEMGEDAFNVDDFITAVFESDNYHGISKLESAMAKIKSKLSQMKYTPSEEQLDTPRYVEDAYKATVGPREIKGKNIGTHTGEIQRYFTK